MSKAYDKSRKLELSTKEKIPSFYNVIILNDDFTTMEFVVKILVMFFNLTTYKANIITLKIHNEGSAVVGTYPKDVAETLIYQVSNYSKQNNFPLKCIMELK
jgi:ATP-dependent Clp protease adaptor protein ClpS